MQHRRNYGKASSLSRVSGGDPNSGIINIMQTAFAKNNNAGQHQYQYFINKLNEGRLVYINTKKVSSSLIPMFDLGREKLPQTVIKLDNTLEKNYKKNPL